MGGWGKVSEVFVLNYLPVESLGWQNAFSRKQIMAGGSFIWSLLWGQVGSLPSILYPFAYLRRMLDVPTVSPSPTHICK